MAKSKGQQKKLAREKRLREHEAAREAKAHESLWGVVRKKRTPPKELTQLDAPFRRADTKHLPSKDSGVGLATLRNAAKYDGELAERERKAQDEIARKKLRVAVPFNKGAYQYISEGMDPTTIGRK